MTSQHWVDIGVNLTDKRFQNDLDTVVAEAAKQNVKTLIITGTSLETTRQALALAETFPKRCYCTVGIHPHHAKEWSDDTASQLGNLAQHPQVVAIGETGLDYNRNFSTPEQQRFAFEQQLRLATETKLPLFLHERDALDHQIELLTAHRKQLVGGVAHCFTGNKKALTRYLELDLYIGITGWICDERRGQDLVEAAPLIPMNRLLLETDAPYLTPRSLKPKPKSGRNEPKHLIHIAQRVAELYGISTEELCAITYANAKTLFARITTENQ